MGSALLRIHFMLGLSGSSALSAAFGGDLFSLFEPLGHLLFVELSFHRNCGCGDGLGYLRGLGRWPQEEKYSGAAHQYASEKEEGGEE